MKFLLTLESLWNAMHSTQSLDSAAKLLLRENERRELEVKRASYPNQDEFADDPEVSNNPKEPYPYRAGEEEAWQNGVIMSNGYSTPYNAGRVAMGPGGVIGFYNNSVGGFIRDEAFKTKEEAYRYWEQMFSAKIQKWILARKMTRGAQ